MPPKQTNAMRDVATSALRTSGVRREENVGTYTPAPTHLNQTNIDAERQLNNIESDMQKLGVGLSQVPQAIYETSVFADKVRSNDAYSNFVAGMQQIDAFYKDKMDKGAALTVQDYKDKKDWQNKFYQDMMNNTVQAGDDTNLIFKNAFVNPATSLLMRTDAQDTAAQFEVHKRNTIDNVNETIDKMGVALTPDMVELQVQKLKAVGIGGAREKVWNEVATSMNNEFTNKFMDGIDSPALQGYLENGVLTQAGIDRLYNDTFGAFSRRSNGEFTSQAGDITDEAHMRMKKSFANWIDGFNSQVAKKSGYAEETITDTVAKVDVFNTDLGTVLETQKTIEAQAAQVLPYMKPSKRATVLDTMVKFSDKVSQMEYMDKLYTSSVSADTPMNFDEMMAQDHVIPKVERTIAPDVTVTTTATTLPRADLEKYFDSRLYKDYQTAVQSGDTNNASLIGKKVAELKASGFKGTSVTSAIENNINTLTNTGGLTAKSVGELVNKVHATSSYIETTGTPNISFLGAKAARSVDTYVAQLQERAATDKSLTPDKIMTLTKSYVKGLARDFDAIKNGSKTASIIKNLTGDDIGEADALVKGGVWGETQLAGNSFNVIVALAAKEDIVPEGKDKFIDYAKSKTMEVDPSWYPVGGTSVSMVNPTGDNSFYGKKKVRKNMQTLANDAIAKANLEKKIDISDLSDEDDVRLYQYIDNNGDIMTVVNVYSSGKLMLPIVLSPNELQTGAWTYENKAGVK